MRRRAISVALAGVFVCAAARAAGLEVGLLAPAEPVVAGGPATVVLVVLNPTDRAVPASLERSLACRLESPDQDFAVEAQAEAGDAAAREIPAGGFVRQAYTLVVPEAASGALTLECPAAEETPRVVLRVETAAAAAEEEKQGEEEEGAGAVAVVREGVQEFTSRFATFDPMYFLIGIDPENSKFQVSFDYHFLNPDGPLVQRFPWVEGFHFAYTQTSLWDLASESAPFRDTSYKPELHFLSPEIPWKLPWKPPWLEHVQVRAGLQHESNGRGGASSRSTNFVYAKPIFVFGNGEPWAVEISPKAWLYVANDEQTNPDLEDYRGYFDLELKVMRARSVQLTTHLWWAQKGPTVQVDLSYPLKRLLFGNLDLYVQGEYFNGYAETLLRYNERTDAFRLGLAMIR